MSVVRAIFTVWITCFAFSATAQDVSEGRWVDLTHAFNEKSVYWPTAETFTKTRGVPRSHRRRLVLFCL